MRHACAIASVVLAGCAASVPHAPSFDGGPRDAYALDVGMGDASDGGVRCSSLPLGAATHVVTHPAPPPALNGGTILDGTYALVAIDVYDGTNRPATIRQTWRFSGDQVEMTTLSTDATGTTLGTYSGTYVTNANAITLHFPCNSVLLVAPELRYTTDYDASGDVLRFDATDDASLISTLMRQ